MIIKHETGYKKPVDEYKVTPAIDYTQQIAYQKGYQDGYKEGFTKAIKVLQDKHNYMLNTQSIEIKFNSDEDKKWFIEKFKNEFDMK